MNEEVFVNNDDGLEKCCKTTIDTLKLFAPIKTKVFCGNQIPFMIKSHFKEIMTTSKSINKHLKHKTEENRFLYTQQTNKCVFLLRKTEINYYGNLDEKNITDNKKIGELLSLSYLIKK